MSPLVSTVASALLLIAGVFLLRMARPGRPARVTAALAAWVSVVLSAFYWVTDHLSGNGIDDAAWYHLTYGLGGAGFGAYRGVIAVAVALLLAATGLAAALLLGRRDAPAAPGRRRRRALSALACAAIALSIAPSPALRDIARHVWPAAPEAASFRRLYQKPRIVSAHPPHPNLVFIYTESLERTYLDESLFPGLTPHLRALEAEGTTFTDVRQVGMTGYTIAGIVASQCGIPLSPLNFEGNRMASMDRYLPGAGALGDLLNAEGYRLVYMGGAPLWFAGKGTFFRTHGFHEVLGREELKGTLADPGYLSAWGLYDDSLLDLAQQRFEELARDERPFGLVLLTLETHHPDGHRSRSTADVVYGDGSNPMLNAVKASDELLGRFVARIRDSDAGRNTVIVIASDHLALPNTAIPLLEKGTRRNLFLVLEPGRSAGGVTVDRRGSTLDIGATVLPFLGFDGAIGLGRNLRDPRVPASEIEEIADAANRGVWRDEIARFWEFPVLRRSLAIDPGASRATVDDRTFWIPFLARFDRGMGMSFEFSWDLQGADKAIVASVQKMPEGTPFVLIDRCENVAALGQDVGTSGWCVIAGSGTTIRTARRIEGPVTFSRDDVRAMTGAWAAD